MPRRRSPDMLWDGKPRLARSRAAMRPSKGLHGPPFQTAAPHAQDADRSTLHRQLAAAADGYRGSTRNLEAGRPTVKPADALAWVRSFGIPLEEVRAETWALGGRHQGRVIAGARLEGKTPGLSLRRATLLKAVIRRQSGSAAGKAELERANAR